MGRLTFQQLIILIQIMLWHERYIQGHPSQR